jgi:hypothetical protein
MQNLGILRQLSLGDFADDGKRRERERREEREIMPSLMATSLRWRTHSARTNILKIMAVAEPHEASHRGETLWMQSVWKEVCR